ncbi:MAG: STAS domain-containing protein [Eubacterium sp.]|nr:STAS domain-containing protein [Eubacterium sp.]
MLNINKTAEGSKLTIALEGRLDTTTAPDLEKEVKENLDGVTELVFDMKDLEYISSAGLRVLLSAQKVMNKAGKMTVTNVSDSINEIFEVTGFSDILSIA